jgi:hypothetical protein
MDSLGMICKRERIKNRGQDTILEEGVTEETVK